MAESDVKAAIKKILDAYKPHVRYYMPVQTGFGESGIEDFICCAYGRYVGIETKDTAKRQTPNQLRREDNINAAHGVYLLVHPETVHLVEYFFAKLADRYDRFQKSNSGSAESR